jgi:hypothetical protein
MGLMESIEAGPKGLNATTTRRFEAKLGKLAEATKPHDK